MKNIELLKTIWTSLYDPNTNASEIIKKSFHQDYEQCINGVVMDRNQYIQHVIEQKENIILDFIDYKYVIEKDDALFSVYCPKGRNKNNLPFEAEVIAYFCFSKDQILRIHGQVRLITGAYADFDMKPAK